jgi:hypothetical protein
MTILIGLAFVFLLGMWAGWAARNMGIETSRKRIKKTEEKLKILKEFK